MRVPHSATARPVTRHDDDFVLFDTPSTPEPPRWRAAWLRLRPVVEQQAGSLKVRIAASVAVLVAVSIAVSAGALQRANDRDIRSAHLEQEGRAAAAQADRISHRLDALQSNVRRAALRLSPKAFANEASLQVFVGDASAFASAFSAIFVSDREGRVLVYADDKGVRKPDTSIGDRDYFRRMLQDRRVVVSAPVVGKVSNLPMIAVMAPVLADGAEIVGAVGGSLLLAANQLLDPAGFAVGAGATAMLVDADGRILAHADERRVYRDLASEPVIGAPVAAWFGAAVAGGLRKGETLLDGHAVVAAAVPGTDWWVIRSARDDRLAGSATAMGVRIAGLAIGGGLVGGLLILGLLAWLLRPMAHLEQRALGLLDGSLPVDQGWPRGSGEIGRLARVLQHVMRERAQSEQQNQGLMKRLAGVMAAAPIGIAFVRGTRFELMSREFSVLLGYPDDLLLGRSVRDVFSSDVEFDEHFAASGGESDGGQFDGEFTLLRRDGSTFHGHVQGRSVDPSDPSAGSIWLIADVTERRAERERLAWSAHHDGLTRLHNRAAFEAELQRMLDLLPRPLPISLLFIDLDHFKQVNDNAGHAAGDQVLRDVAACLTAGVRGTDLVARLGGDEFAVILRGCAQDAALRLADGLRAAALQVGVMHEGRRLCIGASIGVVEINSADGDMAHWMAQADAACYDAKRSGRDAVRTAGSGPLRLVGNTAD